jgi:hypothetical protein
MVSAIVCYSLYSNNSPIAMEIIKAIVYITAGSLGGYGVAKAGSKSKDSDSNNSDQPDS